MPALLKKIIFGTIDNVFAWFTPSWRRNGHAIISNSKRYLNHYKEKLSQDRYDELATPLKELQAALLNWDRAAAIKASQLIEHHSESYKGYKRSPIAEMVESIFVILVVFLAIRSYYAQPFRIPTGSMQPSLNGIIIHPIDESPSIPERLFNMAKLGSSYVDISAETPKSIVSLSSRPKWMLFIETVIEFDDGSSATVPSAPGAVIQYLKDKGKYRETATGVHYGHFANDESIIRGRVDAGDMIIVNRMAYHFRKPERGESFVFDTRGINTSGGSSALSDQSKGTHYIKRLVGCPGDTLSIESPQLLIDGKPAKEASIQRVVAGKAAYNSTGYVAINPYSYPAAALPIGGEFKLSNPANKPNYREYAAMGDNTLNSLDSRYWGAVRQFNVLGPASIALWPFTSHWGLIP